MVTCISSCTIPSSSRIVPGELARVGNDPIDTDPDFELWEGSYRGKEVHIKILNIPVEHRSKTKEVWIWCCVF